MTTRLHMSSGCGHWLARHEVCDVNFPLHSPRCCTITHTQPAFVLFKTQGSQTQQFLFLVLKRGSDERAAYRRIRFQLMTGYCLVFSKQNPSVRHVVGISTGPASSGDDCAHEVAYLDRTTWTAEDDVLADRYEHEHECNLLTKAAVSRIPLASQLDAISPSQVICIN